MPLHYSNTNQQQKQQQEHKTQRRRRLKSLEAHLNFNNGPSEMRRYVQRIKWHTHSRGRAGGYYHEIDSLPYFQREVDKKKRERGQRDSLFFSSFFLGSFENWWPAINHVRPSRNNSDFCFFFFFSFLFAYNFHHHISRTLIARSDHCFGDL